MPHINRGRLSVSIGDGWQTYTQTIPAGSTAIGVVSRDGSVSERGALLRTGIGIYVQCNAGAIRSLPQAKVVATLLSITP